MLNCQNKIFTKLIALHVFSVELKELKNEYSDERKTSVIDQEYESIEEEELIKPEENVITIHINKKYVKTNSKST